MWVNQYLGIQWTEGGREKPNLDCWGLVREVYKEQLSVVLPFYPFSISGLPVVTEQTLTEVEKEWEEIDAPEHLCLVTMSSGKAFCHVGIFLKYDGGLILHSSKKHNVCCQAVETVKMMNTINKIQFYRHGSVHHN